MAEPDFTTATSITTTIYQGQGRRLRPDRPSRWYRLMRGGGWDPFSGELVPPSHEIEVVKVTRNPVPNLNGDCFVLSTAIHFPPEYVGTFRHPPELTRVD